MKQLIFLIFIIFLVACSKPNQRHNEITKIEIATGGCFGPCQLTAVVIDSSLLYHYYGGEIRPALFPKPEQREKLVGYYTGIITKDFWDSLNVKLEKINYKQLDTAYERSVDDESLEVFIHYGNKVKHIKAQSASLPDSVAQVFYYIIKSHKLLKLKSTTDTFEIESKIHLPLPMPNIRKIKFPPPDKTD
jgi:hypothetical protein